MKRSPHIVFTRSALALAVALALAATSSNAEVRVVSAAEWIARDATLQLQLDQSLAAQASRLRFVAGDVDVTALARIPTPGRVDIDLRLAVLAPGESTLKVYADENAAWREVASVPLKLLARGGFERTAFTPKLDLATKSQFAETTTGTATLAQRPHFADLTGRAAAGFNLARSAFAFDGQFNGAGSSFRREALRYGERAERADKFDLADYALNARVGGTSISLGHMSTGSNPRLLDGFASRGVRLAQRFGERLELSISALNATSVVGTDNFFGLESDEHRVIAGGVGVELLPRAGGLRIDLLYMDASAQSRGNFNTGEIPDAEQSHGFGARLAAASAKNRLRGEAVFARSTYVNPFDPTLAQGGASQPVRPATANGYSVELNADLLRNSAILSKARPLTVTAGVRHDRVAPLFRSLGASLAADRRAERGSLGARFAGAQLQLSHQRQRDNLDNVATILRNRTDSDSASVSLPFSQWLDTSWWPRLNLQWQHTHQRALNEPVTENSGFAATHRPDQLTTQEQLGLNWTRQEWSWGYSLSRSELDNRQIGRDLADFSTLGHQLTTSLRVFETFNLELGAQHNRNFSREKSLVTTTDTGTIGFDWLFRDRWSIAANYSRTLGDDSRSLATSANRAAQVQLGYRFALSSFGWKLPGQVFVRYSEQGEASSDASFGITSAGSNRAWNAGLSLSLF